MVINTKNNKYYALSALVSVFTLFTSCTSTDEVPQNEVKNYSELSCVAKGKEFINEESSRSSLTFEPSRGMVFSWTADDEMTVFAQGDYNARQLFKLVPGTEGSSNADFYADNFKLTKDKLYYSFSKTESSCKHVVVADQDNITVDYSGQTQIGNGNDTHLGDFDFMAAAALTMNENEAHFSFNHLGSTVRMVMTFNPSSMTNLSSDEQTALNATNENAVKFTEIQLYDTENSFRQTKRNFDFKTGTSADGKSYSFTWPEQTITGMDRFKLALKKAKDSEEGVSRYDYRKDQNVTDGKLVAYMEIPPVDFRNKKIGAMLKGYYIKDEVKYDVSYVSTFDGFDIPSGKATQLNFKMEKPKDFKVSLKINHMWQHGSTLDNSRATGDPGYDKEIFTPSHIYYIYCHDGKVVLPTSGAPSAVTHIAEAKWDTKNNNGVYISTFTRGTGNDTGIITLDKPDCKKTPTKDDNCEYHLYVVASAEPIPDSYFSTVVADASEETVVRALTYDLPGTGNQTGSDIQVFMRDLYSTPWDDVSFVGDLTDPIQDVILYHVAAKVDLEWNSTTAIKNVSVNSVKNSGLYMFQPTMNTYVSGTYTATKDLTADVDQWYNGRTSFYLPQYVNSTDPSSICKYNVTLGSGPEDITFDNLSTEGGFTSWLRWLKQK